MRHTIIKVLSYSTEKTRYSSSIKEGALFLEDRKSIPGTRKDI